MKTTPHLVRLSLLLSVAAGFELDSVRAQEKALADELPRIPHVDKDKAISTFAIQAGFKLELVAAEPQVSDPVAATFDENGRMFVCEMRGYPFSQEPTRLNPKGGGKPDAGIVRLLEDTDGDGKMDISVPFATGIRWPTGVACWKGGVYVLAPPNLWYFKDTDGDRIADERRVVFDGFNRDNVQAIANNLKWGLDNRIYAASGRNPSVIRKDGKELLKLGRNDFSFDPRTETVRAETGGVQFGLSFDDWGNRFLCSNSNHIRHVVFEHRYIADNPNVAVRDPIRSIAKAGAAAPVFRRSPAEPWRIVRTRRRVADPRYKNLPATERVPVGFFTSATSVTVYRGSAWPKEFHGQVFIGDVGANMVHRKKLTPNGATLTAARVDKNVEFLASTDNWFRPTNFVNAPDGTLYVLDMYRETIEHPYSIPDDIRSHLDMYSGHDRGRIYRILGPNGQRLPVPQLGKLSSAALVQQLNSANGWTRSTAQRLLFERADGTVVPQLTVLARNAEEPRASIHALSIIDGLGELTPGILRSVLGVAQPRVVEHAWRLSESMPERGGAAADALIQVSENADDRLQFQKLLSMSRLPIAERSRLGVHNMQPPADGDLRIAFQMVLRGLEPTILKGVAGSLAGQSTIDRSDAALRELAIAAGATISKPELTDLLLLLDPALRGDSVVRREDRTRREVVIRQVLIIYEGLAAGLNRRGKTLPVSTSKKLNPFISVMKVPLAKAASVSTRQAAIRLLAWGGGKQSVQVLISVVSPTSPGELQTEAVRSLARHNDIAEPLLKNWKQLSPAVRTEVVDILTQRVPRVEKLLAAIESGTVQLSELSSDRRQFLRNHPRPEIKAKAAELFGKQLSSDRAAVVKKFESVLELNSDAARGREVFLKKCAACHKHGDKGHAVAPPIVSVQNKSPRDLLIAILDPNREAQPNFTAYSIQTTDGRVLSGLIASETPAGITLRRAEGREDFVPRAKIDAMISSGRTLMPDGLEKELKPQDLADVIAFVKSLKPQPK